MDRYQGYHICKQYMYRYVRLKTRDGMEHDGFIAEVNPYLVALAIPSGEMIQVMRGQSAKKVDYRQFHGGFGHGGFGHGGFGGGFGHGGFEHEFPRRRFFRREFPFEEIEELELLPFFF